VEDAHVEADLGDDDLGGVAADTGDLAEPLDRRVSLATCAIGRDISITSFTASSRYSEE
jgi:hypothetical protein